MLSVSKANKIIYITALSIIIGLCGAYYFGYLGNSNYNSSEGLQAEVVQQDSKLKVTSNTVIKQKIIYSKCQDEEVYTAKPSENLIGLNYVQLQKMFPGWTIDKFDINEVNLSLKVNSLCREHANNMFIGIKDGYVAVYHGKPGNRPILNEVTRIPVSKLMPQDQQELKQGLIVKNREEILRTLEGLQSR